jgi:hypothetical protein
VLLGEPPVDWSTTDPSTARASAGSRDPFITAIMTTEVLAKHRKALVLVGVGHLYHDDGRGTAVTAVEKVYPGRTYVISTHEGFGAFIDLERGHQLEARMKDWPVPSIVPLKASWLADLDLPYFLWPFTKRMAGKSITDLSDAYLYLGSGESLTYERTPDAILDDPAYVAEVSRRFGVVSIDSLRRRNENRSLYSAADIAEAHQFAPGASASAPTPTCQARRRRSDRFPTGRAVGTSGHVKRGHPRRRPANALQRPRPANHHDGIRKGRRSGERPHHGHRGISRQARPGCEGRWAAEPNDRDRRYNQRRMSRPDLVSKRLAYIERQKKLHAETVNVDVRGRSPEGSGPANRDGMPKLPVGQHVVPNWPVLDLGGAGRPLSSGALHRRCCTTR